MFEFQFIKQMKRGGGVRGVVRKYYSYIYSKRAVKPDRICQEMVWFKWSRLGLLIGL
jgi:hypothetical protein